MASKRIWKFGLDVSYVQRLKLPTGAEVLSVQVQQGEICLWALVDPDADAVERIFYTFGTGHDVKPLGGRLKFIDTYQLAGGRAVFHVFEGVDA